MTIAVGDKLPEGEFMFMGEDGPEKMSVADFTSGKKVILFGVPGAFTPTCHGNHLPGFLEHYETLQAKGVDAVAVISVNDVHVMKAWENASNTGGKIRFFADGSADYTKALGLELDASAFGMGIRSKRYAMIIEDGVVKTLNVEDVPSSASASGAAAIISAL